MNHHDLDQHSSTANSIRRKVESMSVDQLVYASNKLGALISKGYGLKGDRALLALMRRQLSAKASTVRGLSMDIPCTLTVT